MGLKGKADQIQSPHPEDQSQLAEQPEPQDLVFRGSFIHCLDEKGRISIPAPFRQIMSEQNQDTVVLTNFITDGARCLDGFALGSWKTFEAKLATRSRFDPQVRKLENYYLARASVCPIDTSGRVNIPPHLRQYAGLEREVAFTASLHGFRIWDKRVWDLLFQEAESALLENPSLFTDIDI